LTRRVLAGDAGPGNVVLDLDGCVYVGSEPVPGAREALETLVAAGFRVLYATNNATKTPEAVAGRLTDIVGIATSPGDVVTSAIAAARMLAPGDEPVLPIGESGLVATLVDAGKAVTEDPDAAGSVVVALDRAISYDRIRIAAHALIVGARFIGTNLDPTFPTSGVPAPGAGAIIAAVAAASGREPEFAGKPFPPMQAAIEELLGPGPTWMVGDRPETDIACGQKAGWTTVLVETGVGGSTRDHPPDHVVPSVADLPGLLRVQ
jgi:HAD superfamily hydrolase (TIGR01450 family)